jgi:RNA-directed DNA polymerase
MRCADDLVMGGELGTDARRIMAVLPKRLTRCGLRMPPTKTALIACRKPEARQETEDGNGPCDLLGLPHSWTTSRRGCWVSKRTTASKRRHRPTKSLWRWGRTHRHAPVKDQSQRLCLKWRGHFQYDGMRGNFRRVEGIAHDAEKAWRYWLSRRSSKSGSGWEQFQKLLRVSPLPIPRIVHHI